MRRWFRKALVGMLAIALIVAGLPLAHASDCVPSSGPAVHQAGNAHHEGVTGASADAELHQGAMMDHAPSQSPGDQASAACKCLNCSSLCAAFVAPLQRTALPERRVAAVLFPDRQHNLRGIAPMLDPGIPIGV